MASRIDGLISVWSMRPPPLSSDGDMWERGARQGWKWAEAEIERQTAEIGRLQEELADWKRCAEERLIALIEAEAKVRLLRASHAISAVSVPTSEPDKL